MTGKPGTTSKTVGRGGGGRRTTREKEEKDETSPSRLVE